MSSNRWDVMGATAFGFRSVWVNRAGMPNEYSGRFRPAAVVPSLSALLALRPIGAGGHLQAWNAAPRIAT